MRSSVRRRESGSKAAAIQKRAGLKRGLYRGNEAGTRKEKPRPKAGAQFSTNLVYQTCNPLVKNKISHRPQVGALKKPARRVGKPYMSQLPQDEALNKVAGSHGGSIVGNPNAERKHAVELHKRDSVQPIDRKGLGKIVTLAPGLVGRLPFSRARDERTGTQSETRRGERP